MGELVSDAIFIIILKVGIALVSHYSETILCFGW